MDTILGIPLGESYSGIRAFADLSVRIKYTNTYPTSHYSVYFIEKANEALEPLKQGVDRHAYCSLKLIPAKSPLVCYCKISRHIAPVEALLSNSPDSPTAIFLSSQWNLDPLSCSLYSLLLLFLPLKPPPRVLGPRRPLACGAHESGANTEVWCFLWNVSIR